MAAPSPSLACARHYHSYCEGRGYICDCNCHVLAATKIKAAPRPVIERVSDPFSDAFYRLDLNALCPGVMPTGQTVTLTRHALIRLRTILEAF